ncbi:MAG TPA: hypothetical protein VMG12_44425, partial [Polyangiaceae bacterium]|nr:hypothetical protein [Polyangiaceae bacterium]
MRAWLVSARGRRWVTALGTYVLLLIVYAAVAGRDRLTQHTQFNHFALLADSWLHGRLDLGGDPPDHAQNNDFAHYHGKWYVPFPALPAALLLPLVKIAGNADRVRDGQFFVWLAPLGPVLLFFALEKLRDRGRWQGSMLRSAALSIGFALGSVYFFTAVQGTVWFAAHVVAVATMAAYILCCIDARHPWLAGLMLGLGYWSRAPVLFAFPLFLFEATRACRNDAAAPNHLAPAGETPSGAAIANWRSVLRELDLGRLAKLTAFFALPLALAFGLSLLHNAARFDDPFDVGYRHLQITWQGRIAKWGLFHYHYLAKNLGVVLTSLPWLQPFRINAHGLALWVTTPVYLYLLWPKRTGRGYTAFIITAACVAIPALFYQNTGWMQFGYRFSNDYAVFLFCALALCGRRLGAFFWTFTLLAIVINAFGAVTFDRP